METPMKQLIEQAIANINSVADVNTVIGEPVTLPNGVTVVPFSKVSVGFATGGSDRAPKTADVPDSYTPTPNPVDKIIDGANSLMDRAPDMIAKCKDIFAKKEENAKTEEE